MKKQINPNNYVTLEEIFVKKGCVAGLKRFSKILNLHLTEEERQARIENYLDSIPKLKE